MFFLFRELWDGGHDFHGMEGWRTMSKTNPLRVKGFATREEAQQLATEMNKAEDLTDFEYRAWSVIEVTSHD